MRCVVLFQPRPFHAAFHLRFGRPLLLFPGMSTSSILLAMCSSFVLITWSYHLSCFSVIFLDACGGTTLVVPLTCLLLAITMRHLYTAFFFVHPPADYVLGQLHDMVFGIFTPSSLFSGTKIAVLCILLLVHTYKRDIKVILNNKTVLKKKIAN